MKIDMKLVDVYNMPDNSVEVLALSPDGILHLTNWRPSYWIFSCQEKTENAEDWYYCEIEINKIEYE